jgi:hypothetical protein
MGVKNIVIFILFQIMQWKSMKFKYNSRLMDEDFKDARWIGSNCIVVLVCTIFNMKNIHG